MKYVYLKKYLLTKQEFNNRKKIEVKKLGK